MKIRIAKKIQKRRLKAFRKEGFHCVPSPNYGVAIDLDSMPASSRGNLKAIFNRILNTIRVKNERQGFEE